MKKSKLIIALSSLSKDEWMSYRKYILMHTGEKSECYSVFKFFQLRKDRLLDLPTLITVHEKYFSQMSIKSLSNHISRLYLWFEDWMVYYNHLSDELNSKLLLIKLYNRRGLYHLANQTAKQLEKIIDSVKGQSIELSRVKSEFYFYQYFSDNPKKYSEGTELLQSVVDAQLQYISQKLMLISVELYNWGSLMNHDYSKSLDRLNKIIKIIPEHELHDVMFHLKSMVSKSNANSFNRLSEFLYSNRLKDKSDIHVLVTLYLLAFSIRIWSKNRAISMDDVYEIHNYAISSGILLIDGKISTSRFLVTISTLSYIGSIPHTNKYIDQWVALANCKDIESIKQLSYAINYFYHEEFNTCLEHIRKIQHLDPISRNTMLSIQSIAFFTNKENDFDLFSNHIFNFQRTLQRMNRSYGDESTKQYLNLVKLLRKMSEPGCNYDKIDLHNYTPLIYKSWFLKELKR